MGEDDLQKLMNFTAQHRKYLSHCRTTIMGFEGRILAVVEYIYICIYINIIFFSVQLLKKYNSHRVCKETHTAFLHDNAPTLPREWNKIYEAICNSDTFMQQWWKCASEKREDTKSPSPQQQNTGRSSWEDLRELRELCCTPAGDRGGI